MPVLSLNAETRSESEVGSGPSGRLRRSGSVPAVVYGLSREAVSVKISEKEFDDLTRGVEGTVVMTLTIAGASEPVLLQAVQRHPVTRRPYSIDLLRLDMTKPLRVSVRVRATAMPADLAATERFAIFTKHVDVECLPADIPTAIEVDASGVRRGLPLLAADLPMGDAVTLVSPPDTVVARIEDVVQLEPLESETPTETPAPADAPADTKAQPSAGESPTRRP